MNSEKFIKACIAGGYVDRRDAKLLKEWVKKHPKDTYDESCFVEVYRYCEAFSYGEHVPYGRWSPIYGGHKSTKRYNQDKSFNR